MREGMVWGQEYQALGYPNPNDVSFNYVGNGKVFVRAGLRQHGNGCDVPVS